MKSQALCLTACVCLLPLGCARLGKSISQSPLPVSLEVRASDRLDSGVQAKVDESPSSEVTTVAFTQIEDAESTEQGLSLEPVAIPPFDAPVTLSDTMEIVNPTAYTLVDVEQLALANNPAIAAASATVSKAAGLRQQVGALPNPLLGYFGQQIADRNTDQHGLFIEQEFVRGDKLEINRQVLGHTQSAQQAEIETQRYRVLTDVRVRFFEAVAAQQQFEITTEFAKTARRAVEAAEQRQEADEGTMIDTLQSQTLLSEVTLAAEQAEVMYRGAWRDLAAIAGLQVDTPVRLSADLNVPSETPDWQVAFSEIAMQSPELAVARALVCEKQALLKRQQVQYIPNVTAQLGAGYDDATNHGMLNVQLSAPIPVWNKNTGNISAAYSDYVRATQNVLRVEQSIRSRLARTAQDYDAAMATVRKYDNEILPQVQKSLDLSEQAYRAGELNFLQSLVIRRSFFDSSIRLVQAKGRLAQAAAKVDGLLLTGGLEAPTDYTDGDGIRGQAFSGQ
ncbi:TolC family protein [Novipirellula artificiosorum]|uniref:Cobalt-zinc-cadmium resistance protein CzcC n=1 Tax=Novipirellula artificiosorum TaxID=2528016 RepID=A0A5C6DVD3_9BACT|nr:TolC family protein [Novipirellula artificiosorum]TWU39401.1 Cobalt-zinc-cadmium resistance protein CzcC precursor [Novipirellula artificiosorum]